MSAAPTVRQRRKDARPQELLDAALELFVEKGFAATRSEEVAMRAGVSKGTLYLYYPSKEELLKAVIRQTLAAKIAEGRVMALNQQGSPADKLLAVLPHWWGEVYRSPASGVFKLVITEMCNFPELAQFYAEEVIMPGTALVAEHLEAGMACGEFHRHDVMSTVYSIVMPLIMVCLHKHSLGACGMDEPILEDPDGFIRRHVTLVLNGLRHAPEAPCSSIPPSLHA
ncbi:MAG: TetR family transcriptional regulator [Ideonella sp. MAG2]|nr:MAG: TetR family transcriptional regulator [Ideonella sp. MAG2]